jgi:hypothetical protein
MRDEKSRTAIMPSVLLERERLNAVFVVRTNGKRRPEDHPLSYELGGGPLSRARHAVGGFWARSPLSRIRTDRGAE